MTKLQIRKDLEASMMAFIANGGQITKCKPSGKKQQPKPKEEKVVEIEIDFLPEHLRKKHFGE